MLQSSVNTQMATGVVGTFYDYSPRRCDPFILNSASSAAVTATGSVAFGSTNASNNDTVSIGGQTYTFKTSLTAATTANEVLIGSDSAASAANLAAAINGGTGAGTKYGSETVKNAWAVASIGTTTTTVTLTAAISGAAGNNIALSASAATATAFSGGVDAVNAPAFVGYAFCSTTAAPDKAQAGNTNSGSFAGILVLPQQYANYNNLNPTLAIGEGMVGDLCTFGRIYVKTAHAANVGYLGCFRNSDGQIGAAAGSDSVPAGYTLIPNSKFIRMNAGANGIAVLQLGD